MPLDVETGLPVLPENQFWRVKEREAGWWDSGLPPYVEVELVERVKFDHRRRRTFLGIPLGYHAWEVVTKETVIARQSLWSDLKTPDNYAGRSVWHNGTSYYAVTPDSIEPEWIIRAAEKALDEYETKEASKKLLGDYPPKSLNA